MTEPEMPYRQKLALIRQGLSPKTTGAKPKKYLNRISQKKAAEIKEQKEAGSDSSLDRWFEERREEMTGKCSLCQGKSEKKNDDTYRRSCHHLLDKRKGMFPSLALNPINFLEVCFYGNSCHTNLHSGVITWEFLFDSAEGKMIKEKLLTLLPLCTPDEKKNKLYGRLIELVYGK